MIFDQQGIDKPTIQQLHKAIQQSDRHNLQRITDSIQLGELVNGLNKDMQTPLWYVAFNTDQDFGVYAFDVLTQKGANPYHKDINKQTFLFWLAKLGSDKILERALTKYKFALNQNDFIDQTPLYYAAVGNYIKCAELLISHGADANHKDNNGQTPLYYAARQGFLPMCKLLIDNGCNPLHHDKGKKTAGHFAKLKGHRHVNDYLNGFRNDAKRQKLQKSVAQSSQTQKKGRKKDTVKSDFCLVYTNQNGETKELTSEDIAKFKQISQQYAKMIDLMENPDKLDLEPIPQQRKFQKVSLKLINIFWKQQNAYLFHEPVRWQQLELKDYLTVVKHPMDFGTIKTKLIYNAYHDSEEFKSDMNLVFDNCILFNGSDSFYGRIALQMKHEFNAMASKEFYAM